MGNSADGTGVEDLIIVGSGPAGYTAALYASRADLEPLVVEGFVWGGLLQQTTDVENYPGYPDGVMGPEMMQQFRAQAERFGTRFVTEDATRIDFDPEGGIHRVWVGEREHRARAVVLAMGAEPRKLGVPGEEALAARGVSYCATCDAAFFREKPTIVVGGGDTAMEDAIFLSKFASEVRIVHRREEFRASKIMLDRARSQPNIELVTPYVVERFEDADGRSDGEVGQLARAVLAHTGGGEPLELELSGAFIAIGHQPNSGLVTGQVRTDEDGYVETEGKSTRTNVPGVFAAGDLVDRTYRQAVTAAGSGCQAALDAEWYLRDTAPAPEEHWAPDPDRVERAAEAAAK